MHNGRNNVKNICLIFLIGLAIYQVGELWLRESMSRNFFYTAFAQQTASIPTGDLTAPKRILTNLGDNRFKVLYDVKNSRVLSVTDSIIRLTLQSGTYIDTHENMHINELLTSRSVIFEYSFDMPIEAFDIAPRINLPEGLIYFDSIMIMPSEVVSNIISLFFIDSQSNNIVEYNLTSSRYHDALSNVIQEAHRDLGYIYYASSELMGFNFEDNIFLPRWRGRSLIYDEAIMVNNHFDIEPSLTSIFNNISIFFTHPGTVWSSERPGEFVFGDTNQVVRFFDNNTLVYVNYRQGSTSGNLVSDFDVAVNFINRDSMVVNEFFLADFEEDTIAGSITFYFDYKLNNFPIMLSESFKNNIGLNHALEVTVQNGIVTRYKKMTYSFELTGNQGEKNIDAITMVNNMGTVVPNNIRFGYLVTPFDVDIDWVVER